MMLERKIVVPARQSELLSDPCRIMARLIFWPFPILGLNNRLALAVGGLIRLCCKSFPTIPSNPGEELQMSEAEIGSSKSLSLTAEIVAAYAGNNSLPVAELPTLIQSVHDALARIAKGTVASTAPSAATPAVPVRKSITLDYMICLDDGLKFKSLKRHLGRLGMTPQQYRQKWKLPDDYPMTAPNYAAVRAALAKKMGLGRKPGAAQNGKGLVKAKRGRAAKANG